MSSLSTLHERVPARGHLLRRGRLLERPRPVFGGAPRPGAPARPTTIAPPTPPADRRPDRAEPGAAAPGWLRWLWPYLLAHKAVLWRSVVPVVVWTLVMAVAPLLQRVLVDDAIIARSTPLVPWVAALAAVGLARGLSSTMWRYAASQLGLRVKNDIRDRLYAHLQFLDAAAHERMQSGQLISRANSDLNLVQQMVATLPSLVGTVLYIAFALAIMTVLSPLLSATLVVVLIALVLMARRLHLRVYASSWDAQQREADMTTVADEAVVGVRVVKGFGQEDAERGRYVASLTDMFRARVRNIRQRAPLIATLQSAPRFGQVVVLLLGGLLALSGHLTVGTFVAFLAYLADLTGSANMLATVMVLAPRARSGAERVADILAVQPAVADDADPADPADRAGRAADRHPQRGARVRFAGVGFSYADGPRALDGFDLDVAAGEVVAIVGPTGSGKTTALQLIERARDATCGTVSVAGRDVRDWPLAALRAQVSMVFDEAMLMSGTIRENIGYGRSGATDAEIEHVARVAAIHDFIAGLPAGYDTVVGEQGLTLSGGQRQRVALARALLAHSQVLLLDDATSAVDVHVERQILAAMRELIAGKTVLVVAYRESTVELADRVVLVEGGRVVDTGTHAELSARSARYRELLSESPDDEPAPEQVSGITAAAWRPTEPSPTRRARVGDPATPELLAALAALPPSTDEPKVDVAAEQTRSGRFRLADLVRPRQAAVAGGLALLLADVGAMLVGPLLVQHGLQDAIGSKSARLLLLTCAVFGLVTLADYAAVWATQLVTNRTTERILFAMRVRVFSHLQRLGMDFYDRTHAGRIMTRLTSDIDAIAQLLQAGLTNLLVALVSFTGMTAVLLILNPTMALVVLAVIPLAVVATIWYRKTVRPAYERARELNSLLNTYLHETLAILPVTHAFRQEAANQAHFRGMADEQLRVREYSSRATALYVAFIELMATWTIAATLVVGYLLITTGRMDVAELVPFLLYLGLAFAPVQQIASVFDIYQRASTGMRRITALLAEEVSVPTPERPATLGRLRGTIRLDGVALQYRGTSRPALRGADLAIGAGERVAFVGQTGAGKSTIAKVITRFYDVTAGRVTIDGVPLTALDPSELHRRVGYVPQEPFLFSRTIRDNIAYGWADAPDELVEAAARAVGAHEFVAALPGGYRHEVQERGSSLSAGQRQLLCLARALLLDPAVLVLDEATSHLDLAGERRVEIAMRRLAAGRTTLVVAHRPQTLRWVDRVVTVHDGRIVGDRVRDTATAGERDVVALAAAS